MLPASQSGARKGQVTTDSVQQGSGGAPSKELASGGERDDIVGQPQLLGQAAGDQDDLMAWIDALDPAHVSDLQWKDMASKPLLQDPASKPVTDDDSLAVGAEDDADRVRSLRSSRDNAIVPNLMTDLVDGGEKTNSLADIKHVGA